MLNTALLSRLEKGTMWTPSNVSNLSDYIAAWWTVQDHGTANMTDDGGGLISNWVDRVGAMAVTAAAAARPTWAAASFNARYGGLAFDGTANCFVSTTLTTIPQGATAGEIWAVGQSNGAGAGAQYPCAHGGVSGTAILRAIRQSNSTVRQVVFDGATTCGDTTGALLSAPFVMMGAWSGTVENGYVNGIPNSANPTTIATLNTSNTRLRIGALNGTSANGFWNGQISEIMIPKVLTDTIVLPGHRTTLKQDLEGYFAWTYGAPGAAGAYDMVAQLGALHPWRWRPPVP